MILSRRWFNLGDLIARGGLIGIRYNDDVAFSKISIIPFSLGDRYYTNYGATYVYNS